MSKFKFLLLIGYIFFSIFCDGQGEANVWYFGDRAGIDFNSGSPAALTDGALFASEGCASICDNAGALLFYTDGITVLNKNHMIMPNGTGLMGGVSSTQAAIIVKKPGSNSIYYVFTTGDSGLPVDAALRYSEVDMSLQSGLGDVTSNKNILIVDPASEKITAIKHQNNIDFWIIVHMVNSNTFHSYLLTSGGLNMTPVISNIGGYYGHYSKIGCLKGSPNGKRIAAVYSKWDAVELFDFDNTTGLLGNVITFNNFTPYLGPYGVEFSPNSNLLYVSESSTPNSNIYQYNLLAGSATAIQNSKAIIGSHINAHGGAIQLGPDNKIYHARVYESYIGVINNPNALGALSNYVSNGVFLGSSKRSFLGLPNFYNFNTVDPSFIFSKLCFGDTTTFTLESTLLLDSVLWNFGDPSSGINNISSDTIPTHFFTDTGTFIVSLVIYFGVNAVTFTDTLFINPNPIVYLGNDTNLCGGQTLLLEAKTSNAAYLWQDSSIKSTFNVAQQATYWVKATKSHCFATDTINVNYYPLPFINLIDYLTIDFGQSVTLNEYLSNGIYTWSPADWLSCIFCSSPISTPEETITYTATLIDSNDCIATDQVTVIVDFDNVIFVPNSFSPNNDGINDIFYIKGVGILNFNFIIYNRWGEEIFETTDLNAGWDGKLRGIAVSSGIFVYHLQGTFKDGRVINRKGSITIVR